MDVLFVLCNMVTVNLVYYIVIILYVLAQCMVL